MTTSQRSTTLRLDASHGHSSTILVATGDIDAGSSSYLDDTLYRLVVLGRDHLVLDLDAVVLLSAAALGAIAVNQRRALELSGRIDVVCGRSLQRKLFAITGLDQAINLQPDVATAIDQANHRVV